MKYSLNLSLPRMRPGLTRAGLILLWTCGAASLVVFVFAFSFYMAMRLEMKSTEVEVPDLVGVTLEAASSRVEPLELVLEVVEQRHDPAVASGLVLQQVPPAGAAARRGRKIKLILSLGGQVLSVPDTVGQASRTVQIELRHQGFIPGDEARAHSHDAPPGTVIAQVPPPGTPTVPNTRVHRLISNGALPAVWVMPDLTGLDRAAAERWIELSGFRRGALRRVRIGVRAPNTVVGQLPLPGHPIRSKDVVELTVAR